jgi:hypothetical protein
LFVVVVARIYNSIIIVGVFASFLNALPAIECFDMLGLLQLLIDVAFVETTLTRYATARSRRLLEALHAQLATAARNAGAEADLRSPVAVQMKRAALARALHSCRVLFLCFGDDDDDADNDDDVDGADDGGAAVVVENNNSKDRVHKRSNSTANGGAATKQLADQFHH